MNKKLSALLWCGIFSATVGFAQVPGYLGKRFILQAKVNTILNISGPTAANRGLSANAYETVTNGSLAFSNRFEIKGEYAISRSKSLGLSLSYLKTGLWHKMSTPSLYKTDYLDNHSLFYNLSAVSAALSLNKFRANKGALAPMGKYRGFSIWAQLVNGKILDKRTTFSDTKFSKHANLNIDSKFMRFGLGYSAQENFILFDKLVINTGWTIHIPFQFLTILAENNIDDDYQSDVQNQNNFLFNANSRLACHDLFMMTIGFGILPF